MAKPQHHQPAYHVQVGDCLKLLPALEEGSVDLIVADPPYGIDYPGYDLYDDSLKGDEFVAWCTDWMRELYRVLSWEGSFWLYIGDEHVSELDVAAKSLGFIKRSHVIHYYTFGVHCAGNFARSHTHLIYYVASKKFTFNKDDKKVRVPSARQLVYNDKRANPKGKLPDNTWVLSPLDLAKAFTKTEDTWLESRVCGTFGEREERSGKDGKAKALPQMPEAILDRIVLSCSNPGDLVIDPFLGTGTTMVSAVRAKRRFWGCDISRNYVDRALTRVEKVR